MHRVDSASGKYPPRLVVHDSIHTWYWPCDKQWERSDSRARPASLSSQNLAHSQRKLNSKYFKGTSSTRDDSCSKAREQGATDYSGLTARLCQSQAWDRQGSLEGCHGDWILLPMRHRHLWGPSGSITNGFVWRLPVVTSDCGWEWNAAEESLCLSKPLPYFALFKSFFLPRRAFVRARAMHSFVRSCWSSAIAGGGSAHVQSVKGILQSLQGGEGPVPIQFGMPLQKHNLLTCLLWTWIGIQQFPESDNISWKSSVLHCTCLIPSQAYVRQLTLVITSFMVLPGALYVMERSQLLASPRRRRTLVGRVASRSVLHTRFQSWRSPYSSSGMEWRACGLLIAKLRASSPSQRYTLCLVPFMTETQILGILERRCCESVSTSEKWISSW